VIFYLESRLGLLLLLLGTNLDLLRALQSLHVLVLALSALKPENDLLGNLGLFGCHRPIS